MVFRARLLRADWIITALRTITPKHRDFRQISIHVYFDSAFNGAAGADIRQIIGEQNFGRWLELDRFLVQLWESRSIRPRILHHTLPLKGNEWERECVGCLLPEMMGMGIANPVERMW